MKKAIEFAQQYNMLPYGTSVIAAVSGGADSMCLLLFLLENSKALGLSVSAAHFNHLLRGSESDRDECFVKDFCISRKVPFFSGRGDVAGFAKEHGVGTEAAARVLRYAFLEETRKKAGADVIATAHNADDNAETVLLNLTRGAGLQGLRGIPPVRDKIIRPLLCITRAEIECYLSEHETTYVTDSTNLENIYSRNKIRHDVIPILRELNPRFSESVFRTSETLRLDEDYLANASDDFIKNNVSGSRVCASALLSLSPAVSSRVIRTLCGRELSQAHEVSILELCKNFSPSARLDIPGGSVYREYGDIVFGEYLEGSFEPVVLEPGKTVVISPLNLEISLTETNFDNNIHKSFTVYLFKTTEVYGKISIRPRISGDKIRPRGTSFTKTLKKLLSEKHIPAGKRELIPVIADDAGVLAVHGVALGNRALPDQGDTVYKITFKEIV